MCWKALVCFESGYVVSVYDVDISMLLQLMLEIAGMSFTPTPLQFYQFISTLVPVPVVVPIPSRCWLVPDY